jgi:hypothetical protein
MPQQREWRIRIAQTSILHHTQTYTTLRISMHTSPTATLHFYSATVRCVPVGSEVALVVRVLPGVQQVVVVDILPVGNILTLYTQSSWGRGSRK